MTRTTATSQAGHAADATSGELVALTHHEVELVDPRLPEDLSTLDDEQLAEHGRKVVQFKGQIDEWTQWQLGGLARAAAISTA